MVASGFDCEVCGKILASKSSLARHQPIHKDLEGPSKQLKGRIAKSSRNTGKDQLPIRPRKEFECEICGKKVAGKTPLAYHKKTHLEGELFNTNPSCQDDPRFPCKCSLCNKKFTTLSSLKMHRSTHLDELVAFRFDCNICGNKYKDNSSLKRHSLRHLAEPVARTFDCDICGKLFVLKSHVAVHKQSHLPAVEKARKRFKCECCGIHLSTAASLRRHVFTHSSK